MQTIIGPMSPLDYAQALAAETVEALTGAARRAIAYAEAYEPAETICLVDGSQLSPSDRACPGGETAYRAGVDVFDNWRAIVDMDMSMMEVRGNDSDEPEYCTVWTCSGWDEGCLWIEAN